jgi:hypothetical protein
MVIRTEKKKIVSNRHDHETGCPDFGTTVVDDHHHPSTMKMKMKICDPRNGARTMTRLISSATQMTKMSKRQLEAYAPATGRRVVRKGNER